MSNSFCLFVCRYLPSREPWNKTKKPDFSSTTKINLISLYPSLSVCLSVFVSVRPSVYSVYMCLCSPVIMSLSVLLSVTVCRPICPSARSSCLSSHLPSADKKYLFCHFAGDQIPARKDDFCFIGIFPFRPIFLSFSLLQAFFTGFLPPLSSSLCIDILLFFVPRRVIRFRHSFRSFARESRIILGK